MQTSTLALVAGLFLLLLLGWTLLFCVPSLIAWMLRKWLLLACLIVFLPVALLAGVGFHFRKDLIELWKTPLEVGLGADWLEWESIPPTALVALLAIENTNFVELDTPFDSRSIVRAVLSTLRGRPQGASGITMQVTRIYFLPMLSNPYKHSFRRKFLEAVQACRVESRFSKSELCEIYMNKANFAGAIGLRRACWKWYGREPADCNNQELIALIGSLTGPSRVNTEAKLREAAATTIHTLHMRGFLVGPVGPTLRSELRFKPAGSPGRPRMATVPTAKDAPVQPQDSYPAGLRAEALRSLPAEWRARVGNEHLSIEGTFDLALQSSLQALAAEHLGQLEAAHPGFVLENAIVCVDIPTGEVRALISSRDPSRPYSFNTQAMRSAASWEKILTTLAALETGRYTMAGELPDAPVRGQWPHNFGGKSYGRISLRKAVIHSVNRPFAQLLLDPEVGARLARLHQELELPSIQPDDLSVALGTNEVTNLGFAAAAFAMVGGDGVYRRPLLVRAIRSSSGAELYRTASVSRQVVSASHAAEVFSAMRGVLREGTGSKLPPILRGGAKTATTSSGAAGSAARDLRVGYTLPGKFAVALWVGAERGSLWLDASAGKDLAPYAGAVFVECEKTLGGR